MKISIIIPVCNNEKTIKRCIESVVKQTVEPYEVIVVDNNSSDNTIKIVGNYGLSNLKIVKTTAPDIGRVRNRGVQASTGDYILFLDSDDYLDEMLIEVLSNYSEYDLIRFQPNLITDNEILKDNKFVYEEEIEFNNGIAALEAFSINKLRYGVFWIYCIKKDLLKEVRPYKIYEDTATIPFMIEKANKIINISYYGYNHVENKQGLSKTISQDEKEMYFKRTCDELIEHYKNNDIVREYYMYHLNRKIGKE